MDQSQLIIPKYSFKYEVHVGEDIYVWVVSYLLTRTHELDKWIKHSADQLCEPLAVKKKEKEKE